MILLATNKRDVTTDMIVLEARRRGLSFLRLNTEDVSDCVVAMEGGDPSSCSLRVDGREWRLADFMSGYFRRPLPPRPVDGLATPVSDYVVSEWSAILRTVWNGMEDRWLNSPFAIMRSEDKPRQLAAARQAGFQVPDTLVTNDFELATAFIADNCVAKPLRQALLEDDEGPGRVIFTSRVEALTEDRRAAFAVAPMILQREIPKRSDVRATVVDGHVFAARIDSQSRVETTVDWRRGSRTDLAHSAFDLPDATRSACIEVVRRLGLRFAAIDLVEDRDGEFWFLEANPNGQWAWIEHRTRLPIASAIVEALTCR